MATFIIALLGNSKMNMTLELFVHSHNIYVDDHSTYKALTFKATARLEIFKTVAYEDFKMKGKLKVHGRFNPATVLNGKVFITYKVMKIIANVLFIIALLGNGKIN